MLDQGLHPLLELPKELAERLIRICVEALPGKAYGMLGGTDVYHPTSIYPCSTNLRNAPEWRPLFESFGDFYHDPDRGFVVSLEEQQDILGRIKNRGESFVGVFHSHRFTSPDPSKLDMAFHIDPRVPCYIVSVQKPGEPELKVYRLESSSYREIIFQLI